MALKSAGFLAAIERGAHFIFQANPGKILILMIDQPNIGKILKKSSILEILAIFDDFSMCSSLKIFEKSSDMKKMKKTLV